jgi:Na+/H+ antiporter NhaC
MICSTGSAAAFLIPALGATLAGSVYGDHCSPISDTTILASTGAECVHIRHVETQLPYATLVAVVCTVGYIIVGLTHMSIPAIVVGLVLLIAAIMVLSRKSEA